MCAEAKKKSFVSSRPIFSKLFDAGGIAETIL